MPADEKRTPHPTSVRLDEDVREFVVQVAETEHRSVNNTINVLLREAQQTRKGTER